jgi:AraC-like DNA-binding protein
MRHLRRYLGLLLDPAPALDDPTLSAHVGTTLADLMALSLGARGDAAEAAQLRGLRAARLRQVLREINAAFADPSLTPGGVGLKLGISARYIQELLQASGASFTERVLELRLQNARKMLMNGQHDKLKVSDIAAACGFNEVSYFNRRFRRRFGTSPMSCRIGHAKKLVDATT